MDVKFGGKFLHPGVIGRIRGHQHIGDGDAQPLSRRKRMALMVRSNDAAACDGVVHLARCE